MNFDIKIKIYIKKQAILREIPFTLYLHFWPFSTPMCWSGGGILGEINMISWVVSGPL